MKKIQYSAGVKTVVVLLQEIFAVILVLCIVLLTVLFDRSMVDMGDLRNKSFAKSGYYEELFQNSVYEVLNFVSLKDEFETEGVYDPEKPIDIRKHMGHEKGVSKIIGTLENADSYSYYLKDLEDWSKGYTLLEKQAVMEFYISDDGIMHQQQTVTVGANPVMDSEKTIQRLEELDASLQRIVVENVQHIYGGYYELESYEESDGYETSASSAAVFYRDTVSTGQENVSMPTGADETAKSDKALEITTSDLEKGTYVSDGMTEDIEDAEVDPEEEERVRLLEESIQRAINGELFDLEGEALVVLLQSLELQAFGSEQKGTVVKEDYLPVSGSSILDRFLQGKLTLQQMNKAYEKLEFMLNQIGDEISSYKRSLNRYEKDETNLSYWIYMEDQVQPFTNIEDAETGEELLGYGKKQGSYFYYNEAEIRLDTNVNGMEDAYYNQLEKINNGKNRVILVAVNVGFPYEDSFYQARAEYNSLQPWIMISLIASVISVFGFFLCFVYLNMASGRKPTDEEIHLCWFDKIKTELMLIAFFWICLGIIVMYVTMDEQFLGSELAGLMIMSGGITFTATAIFMLFYLSFVRRIKASVMWTGSFVYWMGKGIQKVIRNRKPAFKILLYFGLHVVACIGIGMMLYVSFMMGTTGLYFLAIFLFFSLSSFEVLRFLREGIQRNKIMDAIRRIAGGDLEYEINVNELKGDNKTMGEAVNTIGEGLYHAVDDSTKNERLKADLITNVSHDIKTPLTSIINYVDLIKREDIPNERVQNYIQVLDAKSQRLKQLTEDLVEASKVSSGNITLQMERINLVELVYQTGGEFNEKFETRGLTAVTKLPREPVVIMADGRRIWRVIENLYNNVAKYAMMNTRVYVDMEITEQTAAFSIKNISEQALNIDASELTERFIRGDVSRSTEGSGLGLSIAKNLTELMEGSFDVYLDGDLFKVTITFPRVSAERGIEKNDKK